jgi:hypothetical protein
MLDYKRWVADYSTYELFFCDLFKVRESKLGKQFLLREESVKGAAYLRETNLVMC